jgi:hypothetical protein
MGEREKICPASVNVLMLGECRSKIGERWIFKKVREMYTP